MRISLCMIVWQEEKALERCLEGIADAVEEIVIVDTGSTDRTKEIARQFTDKIYDFPWVDDFAAARNFAFSKGTGEYLLWMDAEDILPSGEKEKLLALKADLRENPCDMVMMLFDRGVDEGGRTKFSCYRERLVRRCPQARWQGRANEVIPPFGSVRYEEIHFVRRKEKQKYSDCNLRIYEKMLAEGEKLSTREWFYYGRELFAHEKQEQAAEVLRKFLENPEGGRKINQRQCGCWRIAYGRREKRRKEFRCFWQACNLRRRQGSIAAKSGNIFMKKGGGSRQFSGMKMRCMQKDARSRGRLCRRNAMDFCPVFGFVSAMAGWGNGRWRGCITKWQGYSDRRMHRCGRIGSILRKGHKKSSRKEDYDCKHVKVPGGRRKEISS